MGLYFSGQGRLLAAPKNANGNPLAFLDVGNVPKFDLSPAITTIEHKESTSGNRLVDLRLRTDQKIDLTIDFQEVPPENLRLLLFGNAYTSVSGSVTGELLGDGATNVVNGQVFNLKNLNVASLVITDSAGTPATLTLGTDYTVNLPYGLVTILNTGSYVQPFKAAYSKNVGQKSVDMFTVASVIRYLRFLGINTAQQNPDGSFKRCAMDLYNVQFDPTTLMAMIGDAVADMSVKASVLVDTTRSATAQGGQIGNFVYIDP